MASVLAACLKHLHALEEEHFEILVVEDEVLGTPRAVTLEEVRKDLERWFEPMQKKVSSLEATKTTTRIISEPRTKISSTAIKDRCS